MFIDLGTGRSLTDEQFEAEMAKRRENSHEDRRNKSIGCPLCTDIRAAEDTGRNEPRRQRSELRDAVRKVSLASRWPIPSAAIDGAQE